CTRSRLLRRLSGRGGMAVVGLSAEDTAHILTSYHNRLSIAASNSPASTVVAGDLDALADLGATLDADGTLFSSINVDVASHSPQTLPLGTELRSLLQQLRPGPAAVSFVSTVTGTATPGLLDADYWARNLTEPVNFTGAIRELVRTGHTTFVEISPHPVLLGSIQQEATSCTVLPSTRRHESERHTMLTSLAAPYAAGR